MDEQEFNRFFLLHALSVWYDMTKREYVAQVVPGRSPLVTARGTTPTRAFAALIAKLKKEGYIKKP